MTVNRDFVAEILRATETLRAGNRAGATDIIQAALAAGGLPTAASPLRGGQPAPGPRRPPQPLGEVVSALAAARRHSGLAAGSRQAPAAFPAIPDGAAFLDRQFACAAGTRRYRLYVPASAGEGVRGMVVMLHGCTQSPEDFAAGTGMNGLAERHRLLAVYPAQDGGDNAMSCWNWFRPQDQMRGAGEPAIIAGMAQAVRDDFTVPHGRIFVAGLSAGGAMAAIMAQTYPELFAAVGIHSGLAYGSASDVVSAFGAMRGQPAAVPPAPAAGAGLPPRLIVFHGSADDTVHPVNARRIVESRADATVSPRRFEHAGSAGCRPHTRMVEQPADGPPTLECWIVEGARHAWSGGHPGGSFTEAAGPSASAEMVRFFLAGP